MKLLSLGENRGRAVPDRNSAAPDRVVYAAIAAAGALLFWLSADHPSWLPAWAPWDFSPLQYLVTVLTLFWYLRGLRQAAHTARPSAWRRSSFLLGLGLIWAVLQTRFEYWSQHMFFLNSIQHVVMHHTGPLLIALGGAGPTLRRGVPAPVRKISEARAARDALRALQQPAVAVVLFSGLAYALWLVPAVQFRAMLDWRLYTVMNWSMVLSGILFWSLVLDPRPKPPARASFGTRMAIAIAVMFPQIALGATITFSQTELYPFYTLCGRLLPSIGVLLDQHIGGIVIWDQATMSAVAVMLVLNAMRRQEEAVASRAAVPAALGSR